MPQAIWNDVVIADSNQTLIVEGNHYFPPESVNRELLRPNSATTECSWKGTANYYDVVVGDEVNEQAAWYYHQPRPEAAEIQDYVAFWKGVRVVI